MTRAEIKQWAKTQIKKNYWLLIGVIVVASIITNIGWYSYEVDGYSVQVHGYSLGWIFYFVEVGLTWFMVKYINDETVEFKDIFHFGSDFLRCLLVNLLQGVFIFLWALLLVIPGIVKAFSYALVPYLLADEKYKDLGYKAILNKSQEMMNGHKGDLFVLGLSFIGWHILGGLTLGILEIFYVIPYQKTATVKFLNDIKLKYEGVTPTAGGSTPADNTPKEAPKFCPTCGAELKENATFCSNCGTKI